MRARPGAGAAARRGLALALAGVVAAGLCGSGACASDAGSSAHTRAASTRPWPAEEQQASLRRTLEATEQVLAMGDHHLLRGGTGGADASTGIAAISGGRRVAKAGAQDAGGGDMAAGAADRREQANVKNGLSGMVMPVVMVLVFLFFITLMKECARMMWRRALLRTMSKLKANQEVFVLGGNEYPQGVLPMLESGRWSIKWQDGHRERYTSLTLRVDPASGTFMGTGRDSAGECVLEGVFHMRRDRIAWTQVYSVRRHQMQMEVWGFLRRDGERGPVVGRGQFQTSDAIGSRGSFVLRPVLVESIIAQIMQRINMRPPPPDRPPVPLLPLPPDCAETMDMTCAICLDENRAPTPPGDEEASAPGPESHDSGAESSGMLACGHAFHKTCIEKWLREHDQCPTCKQVLPRFVVRVRACAVCVRAPRACARAVPFVHPCVCMRTRACTNLRACGHVAVHTRASLPSLHGASTDTRALSPALALLPSLSCTPSRSLLTRTHRWFAWAHPRRAQRAATRRATRRRTA